MANELIKAIEVDVHLTDSDFRRVLFGYHKKYLIFLGIAFVIIGIPLISMAGFALFSNFLKASMPVIIFTLAPPFSIALMIVFILCNIRKQAANLSEMTERTRFVYKNDGVDSISPAASTFVAWSKFRKIRETLTDFVFFPQTNIFYPVPKRFFHNDQQIVELRTLISEMAQCELDLLNNKI